MPPTGPPPWPRAAAAPPDLVVLDLMLPGLDGLEVCRRMRERASPVPVVMLTARGDEEDRILGLEVGADDYVTKPFSPRELVLRVESVLRRSRQRRRRAARGRCCGPADSTVDPAAAGRPRTAASSLAHRCASSTCWRSSSRHPGRAFSREELMREVWGWEFGDLSTVTVHVRRLRREGRGRPGARPG